ncbi:MAG: lipoyl domain-containing protein, partial [Lachnospiraceae bacterium]|nr:lipoyl domain-containing protein [Lachnospiraceae bacterium]
MATVVIMPRQGQSVESCIITSWAKKVGDEVKAGDVIFSYETDKSSFDETTEAEGVMLAEFYGEGDEVPCLENVCVIGAPGEDISQYTKGGAAPEAPKAEAPKEEKKARRWRGQWSTPIRRRRGDCGESRRRASCRRGWR